MLAVLAREFQAQCFLQCGAQCCQTRQIPLPFDARLRIARVGGQKPCHFFGRGERRGLQQHPGQIFVERIADGVRQFLRIGNRFPERLFRRRKRKGFELCGLAQDPSHNDELAQICDDHQAVFAEVFCYLLAAHDGLDIVVAPRYRSSIPTEQTAPRPPCERLRHQFAPEHRD